MLFSMPAIFLYFLIGSYFGIPFNMPILLPFAVSKFFVWLPLPSIEMTKYLSVAKVFIAFPVD